MKKEKRMVTVISSKTGKPLVSDKQQRNTLCDCGSGKKCKKCCGATHNYYDSVAKKVNSDLPLGGQITEASKTSN